MRFYLLGVSHQKRVIHDAEYGKGPHLTGWGRPELT